VNEMIKTVLKISEVKNNPNNPRLIKDDKFKNLVTSIQEFPEMLDTREVVVNKDHVILGGNMRFKAAKEAGLKEVPVKIVDWDEDKQRQFIIKDNVAGGEWDWDMMANEWDADELAAWGLDLPADWAEETEVVEDEAPEVSDEPPVSKLGEIYQLGRHRIMCADSTVKENVELLMNGEKTDMVFTDPPYNFEGEGAGFLKSSTANMRDRVKDIIDFEPNSIDFIKDLDVHSFLFFCNKALIPMYLDIFKGYTFDVLVWHKTNPTPFTSNGFLPDIEYLLMFTRKGRVWNNSLKPTSVYSKVYSSAKLEGREGAGDVHPTMKPIKLLSDKMRVCSSKNGGVLDLFLGSGSTLIACEQTDRTCYGMELDEKYVDVVRKRYHKFVTGSEEGWEDATKAIGV